MIGLVMAGGKGSRMHLNTEKLFLKYKKPIVLHVINALKNSKCFERIVITTSHHSPKTMNMLKQLDFEIIETSGIGYVEDLNQVLCTINDVALVTSGDLPLLDGDIIKQIIAKYDRKNIWTSFVVTKDFLDSIKFSGEFSIKFKGQHCLYTGISLVNAKQINSLDSITENYEILNDKKIAFNINTKEDYELLGIS